MEILSYLMQELPYLAFILMIIVAGIYDIKKRSVPDILPVLMWGAVLVIPRLDVGYMMALIFFLFFFVNVLLKIKFNKEWMGWGDLLSLPPFAAIMYSLGGFGIILTIACIVIAEIAAYRKKEVPLVAYFAAFYLIAFFAIRIAPAL